MANGSIPALFLLLLITAPAHAQESATRTLLEAFAQDFVNDEMFTEDIRFGVEVDGIMWDVNAEKKGETNLSKVTVLKQQPPVPTFYFKTNEKTLQEIYQGKINALTAGVKAFSTDYAPLDIEAMEGFQPEGDFAGRVLPLTFHFFTRGTPEIIPFGPQHTRATHGAQASIFYYDTGLRTGYGVLHPGQHANEHPKSRTNPFSSMLIILEGKIIARLNDTDHEVTKGHALFIPPGMSHEILNPFDEQASFILLMFGEGA